MAQQQSHVPKFGNWDSDSNIPYTTYFENARREKAGGVRMNPNDPEENPEAFGFGRGGNVVVDNDRYISDAIGRSGSSEAHGGNWAGMHRTVPSDQHVKGGNHGSRRSDSGSDKSSSTRRHSSVRSHAKADRKKDPMESNRSLSQSDASLPGHVRQRSGTQLSLEESHRRSTSIPKFGAWDETDPRSGESFTVIFNKVKEEKHIASSKLPVPRSPEPLSYTNDPKKQASSSCRSKICCCLFSGGSD